MVALAVTLREKLTTSVTLRRDETTQSFKLGCVIATKLGALVPPPPTPPSCWSCPPGIPSPTGWETGVVSVRLCSSKTGPGSDSCVSPERSRRSRRRRRVPVQPYLLFLSPLLFHPVLKLQLSSHNNSSSSGEAGKHTTSSRKTRARLRWRLSFRDELRAALRCDAALFLEKKS